MAAIGMGISVKTNGSHPRYSLILPIYNEEAVLPALVRRLNLLVEKLDAPTEIIFVDDGSNDTSAIFLRGLAASQSDVKVIELSRNFGHQIAITAGMDAAQGEAVIVMDADLQDPPEVVLDLIAKWKEGYEIVYARRVRREGETMFKRASASIFYRLLNQMTAVDIPRDVGDFRLIGRKALDTFRAMPERDRFVRGMFGWMGFKQAAVDFERPARAAGETKYPFWKMLRLAVHGIISFSEKPLRVALWAGILISSLSVLLGVYAVVSWALDFGVVRGWASTVVIVSFLSGINLFMTGIVGLYVGGIHSEIKRRPLYVVDTLSGFDEAIARNAGRTAPGVSVDARFN